MAEYIEREAVCRAYMDLCLAKSKLAKSRKGAAFFQSDLLPEVEPTNKELLGIVMAAPAADVAPVVRCKDCIYGLRCRDGYVRCSHPCGKVLLMKGSDFCSYGERKDGE